MKINVKEKSYNSKTDISHFIEFLSKNQDDLKIEESSLYYDFPVFKDFEGELLVSQVMIISQKHGIILVTFTNSSDVKDLEKNQTFLNGIEQLHSFVFSRLLRNKTLRKSKTELIFPINSIVFDVNLPSACILEDINCISSLLGLKDFFKSHATQNLSNDVYFELIATIEGAKGLLKPKDRIINDKEHSKGSVATEIEREINSLDQFQRMACLNQIVGPERIRGLAGSGKTVVLALKAAITHLRHPEQTIVYTFYTKSLYQHIKRLITRFYRQYDDNDPDWNKLKIIHAWGNSSTNGIYREACDRNEARFYSYSEALENSTNPFDFACQKLLLLPEIAPIFDFVFIDEGQDFPESFIKLCLRLCNKGKIVWAYDELQTIFQTKTPKIESVLEGSPYNGLEEDVILYKCYRNPREVLVTAHALGFGVYGKIVQMVDEAEYWNDIGYKVIKGEFKEGDSMVIERPEDTSIQTLSKYYKKNEIIKYNSYSNIYEEISACVNNIKEDLKEGLLPDDILVTVVDDRNAKAYLNSIQALLAENKIKSNNIHSDKFTVKDFSMDDRITLSTVHKAKGNEAYSVHILGIDALYSLNPSIRERNLMFTAMTRTKGWVSLTGVGNAANKWIEELNKALEICPRIEFKFPSKEEMKIMERDIKENATRKSKQSKILDDLLKEMSPDEIQRFLEQRMKKD